MYLLHTHKHTTFESHDIIYVIRWPFLSAKLMEAHTNTRIYSVKSLYFMYGVWNSFELINFPFFPFGLASPLLYVVADDVFVVVHYLFEAPQMVHFSVKWDWWAWHRMVSAQQRNISSPRDSNVLSPFAHANIISFRAHNNEKKNLICKIASREAIQVKNGVNANEKAKSAQYILMLAWAILENANETINAIHLLLFQN